MNLENCPGVCARRILEIDWAETPLGPRSTWPIELKKLLFVALRSSAPKLMFWGEGQTTVYNDALMAALCTGPRRIGRERGCASPSGRGCRVFATGEGS